MYFVLEYDLVDDYLERRAPLRAEHLALAREAVRRGELRLAGALAEPPDRALLVFKGPDATPATHFAKSDPYVLHGLVKNWHIRPWTVVTGADATPRALAQVVLFAKDLARLGGFYTETLGLPLLEDDIGWMRLDAGGCVLALHVIPPELADTVTITQPPEARTRAAIKLAFHTDDIDASRDRLVERGAVMDEVRRFADVAICDGLDPEGNVFQITTRR